MTEKAPAAWIKVRAAGALLFRDLLHGYALNMVAQIFQLPLDFVLRHARIVEVDGYLVLRAVYADRHNARKGIQTALQLFGIVLAGNFTH